jgi:hypothetical protein
MFVVAASIHAKHQPLLTLFFNLNYFSPQDLTENFESGHIQVFGLVREFGKQRENG